MGTWKKVNEMERCPLGLNGLSEWICLNILPLGSYDVLIGVDCLEAHWIKLDCYNKNFDCIDGDGNSITIRGIPKAFSNMQISAL